MRRLIGWMAGLAGVAALAKILHRRSRPALPQAPPPAVGDDPAEELRRKLAEARATATTTAGAPPASDAAASDAAVSPGADEEPESVGPGLEERRADVHARAQAAIDAMRDPTE